MIERLREGNVKKGGVNRKPMSPKPSISPPAQKPRQDIYLEIAEAALRYKEVHGLDIYVNDSYDAGHVLSKVLERYKRSGTKHEEVVFS